MARVAVNGQLALQGVAMECASCLFSHIRTGERPKVYSGNLCRPLSANATHYAVFYSTRNAAASSFHHTSVSFTAPGIFP